MAARGGEPSQWSTNEPTPLCRSDRGLVCTGLVDTVSGKNGSDKRTLMGLGHGLFRRSGQGSGFRVRDNGGTRKCRGSSTAELDVRGRSCSCALNGEPISVTYATWRVTVSRHH